MRQAPTPSSKPLNAAMRKQAVDLAKCGAPPRVIALSLGYSPKQYKEWLRVGEYEAAEEDRTNLGDGALDTARVQALEMYRELMAAEAKFAIEACQKVARGMRKKNAGVYLAQWWLERRVKEFREQVEEEVHVGPIGPAVQFIVNDNGRDA